MCRSDDKSGDARRVVPRLYGAKCEVHDLRWRADAQREPVAHAVGDEERGVVLAISAGPIAEHRRAGAEALVEHDLPAVRVPGEGERDADGGGGIERVRVV